MKFKFQSRFLILIIPFDVQYNRPNNTYIILLLNTALLHLVRYSVIEIYIYSRYKYEMYIHPGY